MDSSELRDACLSFPAAVEEFPFDFETSVFKVAGKIFALSNLDGMPLKVNLKCDPEDALHLRATYPAVAPGYHMNKKHWNTVTIDGSLDEALVLEMLQDSYELIVRSLTRAQRAAILAAPPGHRA